MILRDPVTTEKVLKMVELENKVVFRVTRDATKAQIKDEMEKTFNVKVKKINTHIIKNKKIAYIEMKKETPAIDVATKLGLM